MQFRIERQGVHGCYICFIPIRPFTVQYEFLQSKSSQDLTLQQYRRPPPTCMFMMFND